MSSDEIRLELNKLMIAQAEHDEHIRHNAIKETHWEWQKWFWGGTVILLALGIIFNKTRNFRSCSTASPLRTGSAFRYY